MYQVLNRSCRAERKAHRMCAAGGGGGPERACRKHASRGQNLQGADSCRNPTAVFFAIDSTSSMRQVLNREFYRETMFGSGLVFRFLHRYLNGWMSNAFDDQPPTVSKSMTLRLTGCETGSTSPESSKICSARASSFVRSSPV